MTFYKSRMFQQIGLIFFQLLNFIMNFSKNVRYGLVGVAAHAVKERETGFNIQFYSSDSSAILATIVLFFYKEVQLVQSPHHLAILLLVPDVWFGLLAHVIT